MPGITDENILRTMPAHGFEDHIYNEVIGDGSEDIQVSDLVLSVWVDSVRPAPIFRQHSVSITVYLNLCTLI